MFVRKYNKYDIPTITEMISKEFGKENVIDMSNPYFDCFVLDNQNIVGFLCYSVIYDRIEINYIYVNSSYQNQGYGQQLLSELEFYAESHHMKNITLEVNQSNIAAINLYQKMGYVKVAERKGYYRGTDGMLMMKEW